MANKKPKTECDLSLMGRGKYYFGVCLSFVIYCYYYFKINSKIKREMKKW